MYGCYCIISIAKTPMLRVILYPQVRPDFFKLGLCVNLRIFATFFPTLWPTVGPITPGHKKATRAVDDSSILFCAKINKIAFGFIIVAS